VQQVRRVLDPDKDHEEADPYVLALALKLRAAGHPVGVITEDRRSRPTKLSLSDACGLLRIVSMSMEPYLEQQGIWSVKPRNGGEPAEVVHGLQMTRTDS